MIPRLLIITWGRIIVERPINQVQWELDTSAVMCTGRLWLGSMQLCGEECDSVKMNAGNLGVKLSFVWTPVDPFVALQMGRKRDLTPLCCCCWILINSGKRGGESDWWDLYGKNQPWLPCRSTLKSTEAFSHLMGISWLYNFVTSLLLKGISDCVRLGVHPVLTWCIYKAVLQINRVREGC